MKKINLSLFLISIFITPSAQAISDSQLQSISRLGELNGISLKCHYLNEARKIKLSLAQSLPKQRGLGDLFEEETNRSFLELIKSGQNCPGEATIHEMIQEEIATMKERFLKPK